MPNDTSLGSFYTPLAKGGLGIPILEIKAKMWHMDRIHGLLDLLEEEPVVRALLQLNTFERALEIAYHI